MSRLLSLFLLAGVLAVPTQASAVQSNVDGLTATPAIMQLALQAGQSSAAFDVRITNNETTTVPVAITAEDFTYSASGGIQFIGADRSTATAGHGLAALLHADQALVTIAGGATATVTVHLANTESLAVGGHYAAIEYRIAGTATSPGTVGLRPAVSTLVFVSTAGEGTQILKLATPLLSDVQTSLPSALSLVLSNTGNTQTVPRGLVQLYGPGNQLAGQGILNVDSGLILPGANRLFTVNLTQQNQPIWPGQYRLRVAYRHDGQAQYQYYDQTIWYVPGAPVGLLIVAVAAGLVVGVRLRIRPKRYAIR